ncbi:head GIN domain-containing protein [Rubrolithibacter danxiaensis]|uniref:head GIN domain-containing protein n=1 Tax=Rubrolithibacter danxiaensis TaxID=3390805 RepID=UPI003BF7D2F5
MKTTTKLLAFITIPSILFSTAACHRMGCINGSGHQVSQNRTVEPFTSIETGGSVKLILKQDSSQQLKIVADDNIQEHIRTTVSGDRLSIDMDGNFCNSGSITVYATAKNFTGVEASGSVELINEDTLNVQDFHLGLSGASKVNLNINAANFKTDASGSAEIHLKGQARSHEVSLSGSGEVDAFDFVVGNYKIQTSGSSRCRINVLNQLDVETSGASEIEYRGNPKTVNNSQSGSSSIKKVQ